MKTVCIYHSVDLDGWMSAAIVKHWFKSNNTRYLIKDLNTTDTEGTLSVGNQELYFLGYNYGQPIPDLSGYNKVIMCDVSFPEEEMNNLIGFFGTEHNKNFIWLDHHISAISNPKINENWAQGLRDTKFAACELTWQYFFSNKPMPEIVRLLGLYDSFRHKNTDEEQKVLEFQYGARQVISNYEDAYKILNSHLQEKGLISNVGWILEKGRHIYEYLCTEAKQAYKNGFEIELLEPLTLEEREHDVYKFICINKERFNPINFGIDYHKDGYDGCACFHFDGINYKFSVYNDNGEVDCSQIAKQFGGGGHKGAAGMRLTLEQFKNLIKQ